MADQTTQDDFQKKSDLFEALFASGQFKQLAKLYAEDCRFMPEGEDTLFGHEGVIKANEEMHAAGLVRLSLTIQELVPTGDQWMLERGTYNLYNKEGTEEDQGKFVTMWKKGDDGNWLIHFDIFNTNKKPQ